MASCSDPNDWTVLPTGHATGSVACGAYRGWYARNSHGRMQITWTGTPDDGPSMEVLRAAIDACEKADSSQQMSKAGRIDVGG